MQNAKAGGAMIEKAAKISLCAFASLRFGFYSSRIASGFSPLLSHHSR